MPVDLLADAPRDLLSGDTPPASQGTLLDAIGTNLARPGAALRNALINDVGGLESGKPVGADSSDQAFKQGFSNPGAVKSLSSVIPMAPTANPFLAGLETNASALAGATGDILIDPLSLGIPGLGIAGRAIGSGLEQAAARGTPVIGPFAKWLGNETRNLNPSFNSRVNPAPAANVGVQDILNKINTEPNPNPATQVPTDVTPPTPVADAQGQLQFPDMAPPAMDAAPQDLLAQNSLGPVRDPGQQTFDFTQGPVAAPQANAIQLSPDIQRDIQREIEQIVRTPNGARSPAYQGLGPQQLQDLFVQRVANKPVIKTELPDVFNTAQPTMKPLKTGAGVGNPMELSATPEDAARRQQLIADRGSVNDLVQKQEAATEDPSVLADIKAVLSDIKLKAKDANIIEMGSGAKPPDFELGPEGTAALERLKAKVVETMKTTGKSAVQVIQEMHPNLSTEEAQILAKAGKLGNLNLRQYPDEQKQQLKDLFAGRENKLVTKPMTSKEITARANELESLPVTESIGRNKEGQLAAEQRRMVMNDIAKMKAIAEDKTLSASDTVKKILEAGTEKTKKVKTEVGRALGSMSAPLEAHDESLTAMRKIVDRLRADPTLKSSESKAFIDQIKGQFPELKRVTTADVFKEMFRNFITSSPVTWGINSLSNYANVGVRPGMRALEVSSAKIRSLLSGQPTTATYKEIGAMLKGMQDALHGGKLPEELKSKTFSDKYNTGALDTLAAGAKTKAGQAALSGTSTVVNAPANIMRSADEHAKNIMGMMEMYASKARGEDVLHDQNAIDRITGAQARGSFQDEMSALGKWVAQARNYFSHQEPTALNQAGDILTYAVQPFIQTVDRIIAKGINNSVLGAGTTAFKAATGKYTGALAKGMAHDPIAAEKLDRDLAAVMIGAPLFVWTGMQLANGNITGAAPQDTAGREAFDNAGKQEYSIKIKGRWIPMRFLPEPAATAVQINLALLQGMAQAKGHDQGVGSGVFNAVTKIGYMLGTKQYLGGMNSLVNAVSSKESSDVGDPDTVVNAPNRNALIKKILPSIVVPSIVKDAGVIKDTLQGKPRVMADTALEATKRRAGLTGGMVPELNTFGEPVTHPMEGQVKDDAAHALAEKFPPQPVDRTVDGVRLSQQDYHDLKQSVGLQRKMVYQTLAKSDGFNKAPDGVQQIIVEDMVSEADKVGSIPEKVRELKSDPLYYNRKLRVMLGIQSPGGERHFPYLK